MSFIDKKTGIEYYECDGRSRALLHVPATINVEDFTIPYGVRYIKKGAFANCNNLQIIRMGASIENINEDAFIGCDNLKWIVIPTHCFERYENYAGLKGLKSKFRSAETFNREIESIISILEENNIHSLYHFTSQRNLESIKSNGCLLSKTAQSRNKINDVIRGGNRQSREIEWEKDLYDYIHLSFCEEHPMTYNMRRGENVVVLEIFIEALRYAITKDAPWGASGLLFSNKNAADHDAIIMPGLQGFFNVNLSATQEKYLKKEDPLFELKQAEILVRHILPLEYVNMDNIHYLLKL